MGRGGSGPGLSPPVCHEVSSSSQARSNDDRTYSTFQQEFQFVQGLDSKAIRKKTRSWVTTQHYRKKRYEEARAEAAANPISKRKGRGPLESSSRSSRSDDERLREKNEERMKPERAVMGECLLQRLGGGRADPFNSYPIAASRDVHELVDHCRCTNIQVDQASISMSLTPGSLLHNPFTRPQILAKSSPSPASVLGPVQPLPHARDTIPWHVAPRSTSSGCHEWTA